MRERKIKNLNILVDTGTSKTIVLKHIIHKELRQWRSSVEWGTMGSKYVTNRKDHLDFYLLEFNPKKVIKHIVHVDESTNPNLDQYDMIMGHDLLVLLGLKINFDNQEMTWEDNIAPFKSRGTLRTNLDTIYNLNLEPKVIQEADRRAERILKPNKYKKSNLEDLVQKGKQLNSSQK